jgi:hypothetical protein
MGHFPWLCFFLSEGTLFSWLKNFMFFPFPRISPKMCWLYLGLQHLFHLNLDGRGLLSASNCLLQKTQISCIPPMKWWFYGDFMVIFIFMSCIKIYPNPLFCIPLLKLQLHPHFCIPLLQHIPRFSSRLPPTLAATNSVFFSQIKFLTWSKVFVGRTSKVSSNVLYTNTVIIVIMFGCVHPNLYRISQCFSKQLSETKSKYFPARYSTPLKIPQMLLR